MTDLDSAIEQTDNNIYLTTAKTNSILVIGDVMLDKYWFSKPKSLAAEAPVINIKVDNCEYRPGGAANVVLNIKSLCEQNDNVAIYAPLGSDNDGKILSQLMDDSDIICYWQYEDNKTITKHRILANKHQLLRVDFEENYRAIKFDKSIKKAIDEYEVIVISDYNKGSLCHTELPKIISYAKNNNKIVLVDPKGKDFSKYQGATIITPNYKEFIDVIGTNTSFADNDNSAYALISKLDLNYLLLTQGPDGMTFYSNDKDKYHASSYADEVYDVTGAGDTVIASMAVSFARGETIKDSVEYASYAAALVVSQVGTAKAKRTEVDKFRYQLQNSRKLSDNKNKLHHVTTSEAYQKIIADLKNLYSNEEYFIYKWNYNSNNILTSNNILELIKLKNTSKYNKQCIVILYKENKASDESKLSHSIEELAYMLSQISAVDKVIYSESISLNIKDNNKLVEHT